MSSPVDWDSARDAARRYSFRDFLRNRQPVPCPACGYSPCIRGCPIQAKRGRFLGLSLLAILIVPMLVWGLAAGFSPAEIGRSLAGDWATCVAIALACGLLAAFRRRRR